MQARDIEVEGLEGAGELLSTTRDKSRLGFEANGDIRLEALAGRSLPVLADDDLPRQDRHLGVVDIGEETALNQKLVQTRF